MSAPTPDLHAESREKCTRCLQPVPKKAPRCPSCGQPTVNRRLVPLLIGVAGLFVLLFAMAVLFYASHREELMNRAVVEEEAEKPILSDSPPDSGPAPPSRPEQPEKKAPLDEK